MLPRSQARQIAFQILYGLDGNPALDVSSALRAFFEHLGDERHRDDEDEAPGEYDRQLAESFVREAMAHNADIDETISHASRNWRLERMARVDRTILRLAVYEMKYRPEIPAPVTMNEAIELAKRFGAADGPAFVNGILDSVYKALAPDK